MIKIQRDSGYADKLRKYSVVLDGKSIGAIGDGQSEQFDIESGDHILYMKIDWARSNKINFSSANNRTIDFRCASNLRGVRVILGVFYAFIFFTKYIKLERVD